MVAEVVAEDQVVAQMLAQLDTETSDDRTKEDGDKKTCNMCGHNVVMRPNDFFELNRNL